MTDRIVVRQKRNIAGIVIPLSCLIVALLVLGGVLWHREAQRQENVRKLVIEQQQEEARRRQVEDERKAQEAAARKKAEAKRLAKLQQEEAQRGKKAEEERLAAERRAKESATEIRIEAKVQQGKVARISDADGFKARKDSLEDVFIRAEAFYDDSAKRWAEAEALYRDYIEQSKSVISLDGERQAAVAKRSEVQTSFKKAEEAGAKTYARDSWNAAVKTWNAAAAEFGRREFTAASGTFANALREFEDCAIEARNNKRIADEKCAEEKRLAEERAAEQRRRAALARQAEERRRQEERRKAMQSLPGKWRCTTTHTSPAYADKVYIFKYDYAWDFYADGTFQSKLTYRNRFTGESSCPEQRGRWSLLNQILTIVYDKGGEVKYVVRWNNDGTFELRFAQSDYGQKGNSTHISYDADGTEHRRVKCEGGFLRPSVDYEITETAKIFRKVSD